MDRPRLAARARLSQDGLHVLRGICMGCADVVPGVSGGTVALILGIYERLVTAISRVDRAFFHMAIGGQWRAAAQHLDLRFLMALASGIGTGIVGMTLVINHLLTNPVTRALTLAAFFGMILASAIVIGGQIRPASRAQAVRALLAGLLAAAAACWISLLQDLGGAGEPSYAWLFLCGCIAICAMILPGISGAMLLLVLGVYVHLTEIPRNLLHGEAVSRSLMMLLVFGSGCAISLVLFSKVLRWLLASFYVITMSVLCGLMLGALVKLWPFQRDLTPEVDKIKYKQYQLIWPEAWDGQAWLVLLAAVAAMMLVFLTDYAVRRLARPA